MQYLPKEIEYNNLIMEWNKKLNLVSRKKTDVFDLIDDSRIFLKYLKHKNNLKIMDLGTGGGFPGVVIKIHRPEDRLILVDSILKKTTALCSIVSRLELKKITAICSRAEDMAKNNVFKHTFDYVVARSVGSLQDLVKWSYLLIKPGGKLLTLKGSDIDDEIKQASKYKFVKTINIFDEGLPALMNIGAQAGDKKMVEVGF